MLPDNHLPLDDDDTPARPGDVVYCSDGGKYTLRDDGCLVGGNGWARCPESLGLVRYFRDRLNCIEYRLKELEDRVHCGPDA